MPSTPLALLRSFGLAGAARQASPEAGEGQVGRGEIRWCASRRSRILPANSQTAAKKAAPHPIQLFRSHSGRSRMAMAINPPIASASIRQGVSTYAPIRSTASQRQGDPNRQGRTAAPASAFARVCRCSAHTSSGKNRQNCSSTCRTTEASAGPGIEQNSGNQVSARIARPRRPIEIRNPRPRTPFGDIITGKTQKNRHHEDARYEDAWNPLGGCGFQDGGNRLRRKQPAVAQAGDFPAVHAITRQQRRQNQVHHVRLGGPEAAGRRNNRDIVLVSQQQQIPGLHGGQNRSTTPSVRRMDCPITSSGPGRRRGGGHQDDRRLDRNRCCRQRLTEFSSSVQASTKLVKRRTVRGAGA